MYELNRTVIDGQPVIPTDLASAIVELDKMLSAQLKSEIKDNGADSQHRSLGMLWTLLLLSITQCVKNLDG